MVRKKKKDENDPAMRMDHDPEDLVEEGMSTEAAGVDRAETLASTGDAEGSFQEIASGSATGTGVDRVEPEVSSMRDEARQTSPGAGAFRESLGAPPDIDENDGDDSWLQDLPEDLKS
ncbi:MAG TPA: hypothetical protein VGK26_06275 [Thermoanaerobaculia bacterium]